MDEGNLFKTLQDFYTLSDENFYTLSNDNGALVKIKDHPDRCKWYSLIKKTKKTLIKENKKILCLFRGETKEAFCLKTSGSSEGSPKYDRFFIIGSKARSYIKEKNTYKNIRLSNSDEKIKFIYTRLSCLLDCFDKNNPCESSFIKKIQSISNENNKKIVINFYLAFIHTASSDPEKMKANSILISSTRDIEIADNFAEDGFITMFWVKEPICNNAIDYKNTNKYNKLLEKYKLPTIETTLHPEEDEVTIFSAIFPHNIFYIYDITNKKMIFNPYLLNTDFNTLISSGINVDQSNFNSEVNATCSHSVFKNNECMYEK